MTRLHTKTKLAKIMQDIIIRHKLQNRILVTKNDNVDNNFTMHAKLFRVTYKNIRRGLFQCAKYKASIISCLCNTIYFERIV